MKQKLSDLGPWVHNFTIGGFDTREVNPDPRVPGADENPVSFPESRWKELKGELNPDADTVLELGPGSGYMSLKMDRMGYDVTSVEILPERIRQTQFIKEVFNGTFDIVGADALEYTKDCDSFDIVFASGFIYHVEEIEQMVDQMNDVADMQLLLEVSTWQNGTYRLDDNGDWQIGRNEVLELVGDNGSVDSYISDKEWTRFIINKSYV